MAVGRVPGDPRVMASFIVETYVPPGDPERFATELERLRASLVKVAATDGQVNHVRSYLVPSDEMGVHVVEAESAGAVIRLAKLAGIEVERIVPAIAGQDRRDVGQTGQ
jgi:hypothetical protein